MPTAAYSLGPNADQKGNNDALNPGDVRVLITTSDEVSDRCGQPVQACTAGDLIVISQEYMGVYSYILEHELHHWMAQCAYNMGDAEHRNPQLWYGGVGVEDIWALEP